MRKRKPRNPDLIRAKQTAGILEVSTARVRQLRLEGNLPAVEIDGEHFFRPLDVHALRLARLAAKESA